MRIVGKLLGMEIVEVDDLPDPGEIIIGEYVSVTPLIPLPPREEPDGSFTFRFALGTERTELRPAVPDRSPDHNR